MDDDNLSTTSSLGRLSLIEPTHETGEEMNVENKNLDPKENNKEEKWKLRKQLMAPKNRNRMKIL